ncbi:MAG: uroporphyrinogen-III C-methyltransferase, partial [Pseudolabrys sp.]|nr:uroporphyrinogen-III C-methyltransferase [Pseudolabrys sp.]
MTLLRKPSDLPAGRMTPLSRLPVFLALEGKRVLVAGGSAAAAWKAELLSACGAQVDVVAGEISDEMCAIVAEPPRGPIALYERDWCADDVTNAAIAIGAFEDNASAATFAAAARAAGVPINVIDKPDYCDFSFGSIVNRSPLVIGISTDGAAPVFAQAIRAKLEAMLPQGFARWAQAAGRWRSAVKASGLSFAGRRRVWQLFTALAVREPNREPEDSDLTGLLDEVRGLGTATEAGSVTLVGAGPGDPELLTLRAVRALQSADVILFDDLVSREVLDFARREAKKILVGKTGHGPSCKQSEINALMVDLAQKGRRVVRLKGGDPLIFARAGEEIEACRDAGLDVEIVPGITAAQGAASRLGIPLTSRGQSRRLQLITGHARDGHLPDDIDWRSVADGATTTTIYMPAKTLSAFADSALAAGLDPNTPAVVVASATRPEEKRIAARVSDLPSIVAQTAFDGP